MKVCIWKKLLCHLFFGDTFRGSFAAKARANCFNWFKSWTGRSILRKVYSTRNLFVIKRLLVSNNRKFLVSVRSESLRKLRATCCWTEMGEVLATHFVVFLVVMLNGFGKSYRCEWSCSFHNFRQKWTLFRNSNFRQTKQKNVIRAEMLSR